MLTVLNDCHRGTIRSSGVTKDSQAALSLHIREKFIALLPENDLMILGDLFDKPLVDLATLLETFTDLSTWLCKGHHLYAVSGNHDDERTSDKLSSFDVLCSLLLREHPSTVTVVKGGGKLTRYGYILSHMPNQQLFDLELEKVPECEVMFCHVNYDNFFAAQSDQSLNISKEQLEALPVQRVICGHEHHYREVGKILLPGCQISTSVSDWLGCTHKYKTLIDDSGAVSCVIVAPKEDEYIELQWDNLVPTEAKFVRVVGSATTEQASQVVSLIAKFRAQSAAFVISNAVQIASESGTAAFSDSLEGVRAFDVWNALGDHLDDSQIQALKELK